MTIMMKITSWFSIQSDLQMVSASDAICGYICRWVLKKRILLSTSLCCLESEDENENASVSQEEDKPVLKKKKKDTPKIVGEFNARAYVDLLKRMI